MLMDKSLLTLETNNVSQCCLSSLKIQIGQQDIEHDTELRCKQCNIKWIFCDINENHMIPSFE